MKTQLLKSAVVLFIIFTTVSCKDKEEIKPKNTGIYNIWTNYKASQFDEIEVKIDGQLAGVLTRPFTGTALESEPYCHTTSAGAIIRLERTAGKYLLEATVKFNGKIVSSGKGTIEITVGQCKPLRLNGN